MMKRNQIIQTIRGYDHEISWTGDWVARLAAECECARSTVYRAIAYLKSIDAMNDDNQFIGRVPDVEEIQALVAAAGGNDVPVLLTDKRVTAWCKDMLCELGMFWYLMLGWFHNCFYWVGGGSYGHQLINKGGES